MKIIHDAALKDYSTMKLGGIAKALVIVKTKQELLEAVNWAAKKDLPMMVIGGGSNIIFTDQYAGLIIINKIMGFEILDANAKIKVGAGENWDKTVQHSVDLGLSGIELLSLIPGNAGSTPVQNTGAYGAEIANVFVELEALDTNTNRFVTLNKADCHFEYRNSIFKKLKNRHLIITSITLQLSRSLPQPPFYDALQRYLDDNHITGLSLQIIRDAVIAIRNSKLPDPQIIPNTGSFFKNPIISSAEFKRLIKQFPDLPNWPSTDERVKIPAGWLIDKANLKNYGSHGLRIYSKNALIVINENANNYADLKSFKQEVVDIVFKKFGVELEQEPETV